MYDLRGKLLKHASDNDVWAENGVIASRMVRTDFDNNTLWPHIKIKITGAKLYGSTSGPLAPRKTRGLKPYIISFTKENSAGIKNMEAKYNAKNKEHAQNLLLDYYDRTKNRGNDIKITRVVEYGKER
jgi:hypothetical protein